MNTMKLSFCDIKTIEPGISEVVVDSGIEINDKHVNEYHAYLVSNKKDTNALLVNNINDYNYTFEAQQNLLDLEHIKAIAFLIYRESSRPITELLSRMPKQYPWNMRIFTNDNDALDWLRSELAD